MHVLYVKIGVKAIVRFRHLHVKDRDSEHHRRQQQFHLRYVALAENIHIVERTGTVEAKGRTL